MTSNISSFTYPQADIEYALNHGLDPSKNKGKSREKALSFTLKTVTRTAQVFEDACKDVLRLGKVTLNGKTIEDLDKNITPGTAEVFFGLIFTETKKCLSTDEKAIQLATRIFALCCQSVYAPFTIDIATEADNLGKRIKETKLETHINITDQNVKVNRVDIQQVSNVDDAPEKQDTRYTGYSVTFQGNSQNFIKGDPSKLQIRAVKTLTSSNFKKVERILNKELNPNKKWWWKS